MYLTAVHFVVTQPIEAMGVAKIRNYAQLIITSE